VSLATLGGTTGAVVIEYDDVQPYEDPTQTIDFEIFAWRTPEESLGDPDIIFAYDNISVDTPITVGTIGIENALGTEGIKYAYDDIALETLEDGMAICFDGGSGCDRLAADQYGRAHGGQRGQSVR